MRKSRIFSLCMCSMLRSAGYTHVHVHEKKHMLASFEDERSIKYPSPLIPALLIFQMINDGLTKQA